MRNLLLTGCMALCLLTVSCTKDGGSDRHFVKFGVSTKTTMATKTAYSGDVTDAVERIDWVLDDEIRIWSEECYIPNSSLKYSDYTISSIKANGVKSEASIKRVDKDASLQWSEKGTYTFWGLYPSPSTVSDGSILMDKDIITLTLPASQPEKVNMGLGYLAGKTTAEYKNDNSTVDLGFSPMTSTFVINLVNNTTADVTVKSVSFSSKTNAVVGQYTVDLTKEVLTVPEYSESDNSSITVTPSTSVLVTTGNSIVVTIFAVPQDITNAYLTVDTNDGKHTIALTQKDSVTGEYNPYVFKGKWKYNMKFALPELGIIPGTEPINPDEEETDWADILVQGTTSPVLPDNKDIWDEIN